MKIIEQSAEILDWSGLDLYQRVEQAARVCRRSESKGDAAGFVRSLIRRGHFPPLEFARVEQLFGPATRVFYNARSLRGYVENGEMSVTASLCVSTLIDQYPAFFDDLPPFEKSYSKYAVTVPANDWIPVLFVTSRTISHQLVRYRREITFCQESQRHVRYDRDGIEVIAPPGLYDRSLLRFEQACEASEQAYMAMIKLFGATAEQARAVLPGCTATRILAYASPDEWRHIFSQRCDSHADPQMAALMRPLEAEMKERGMI